METKNKPIVFHEQLLTSEFNFQPFIKSFSQIIDKDTPDVDFGFREETLQSLALDVDDMEEFHAIGEKQESMDAAFGIADYDATSCKISNQRIQLIELKLDCRSFNSISREYRNLLAKESHSKDLLSRFPKDEKCIILFRDKVTPMAVRGFKQWINEDKSKSFRHWLPMSPEDFDNYIRFEKDFPYQPITNLEGLESRFIDMIRNKAEGKIIDELYRLRDLAEKYLQKYMLLEVNHIAENVILTIRTILDNIAEEKEMFEYLLQDFEKLKAKSL